MLAVQRQPVRADEADDAYRMAVWTEANDPVATVPSAASYLRWSRFKIV
jgi:hypothetical protein